MPPPLPPPSDRTTAPLAAARAAYARQAWDEACAGFAEADRDQPLAPDDLEHLAWASGLTARDEQMLAAFERLHDTHVAAGDCARAARFAFWLSMRLLARGEASRANGWLTRAGRLVERVGGPCVEAGYLMLPAAQRSLSAGDQAAAIAAATEAAAVGERFGDVQLAAFARALQGRALMLIGRIDEGLALIDDAMVAVTAGRVSPIMTGLIYCSAIAVCHKVYVLDRAREWTAALTGWCAGQPQLSMFTGTCFVHRAEVKQLEGDWPEALAEARRAQERAPRTADPFVEGDALYQRGEIHRLRGELAAAEAAYDEASQRGREPQPGLALLRLSQGRLPAATAGIRRALGAASDPLARTRLLPAAVEIWLAAGDRESARRACDELEQTVTRFPSEVLGALAAEARGAVLVASGDPEAALPGLRRALQVWTTLGAPYLGARVRLLAAVACHALGDADGARLERAAARAAFERLAAAPDLARVAAPAGSTSARGLTAREIEVLKLVAAGKTNKAIAKQLFLSEKTIDRHLSNIFDKIDARTRAAATAFAYEQKLV